MQFLNSFSASGLKSQAKSPRHTACTETTHQELFTIHHIQPGPNFRGLPRSYFFQISPWKLSMAGGIDYLWGTSLLWEMICWITLHAHDIKDNSTLLFYKNLLLISYSEVIYPYSNRNVFPFIYLLFVSDNQWISFFCSEKSLPFLSRDVF